MIIQIQPWIGEEEGEQLRRVIDSTYVTEHLLTNEFEEKIRTLTGSKHAISITNGTMALFCCLKALGIGPGDEVLVPNITFVASANAVILAGAKPVLCEIDKDTFCIDAERAALKINSSTKAIMPVHLYGQSADMDMVLSLAQQYDLKVIEDAAQGVGVFYKGKHTGTIGDIGILSFYGNKTITCGEGGVILTDDDFIAKKCFQLKNHGRDAKGTFIHENIGYNFAFTDMQAAIGIAQLNKLPKIIDRKKEINEYYIEQLSAVADNFKPVYIDQNSSPVYWFSSFLTEHREELMSYLKSHKIQTRLFFYPLHQQPCYKGVLDVSGDFTISEEVYARGVSLPSSYNLTVEEQDTVILKIKEFYEDRH